MKIRKIMGLCLIITVIASYFVNATADEDYTIISEGKPITSAFYGEGGFNNTKTSNANDGNPKTVFYSNAGEGTEDWLVIDLQKAYKIAYAEVSITGTAFEYSIIMSKDSEFSESCEFEENDGKFYPKSEDKDETFRYAKLYVPAEVDRFRIREFVVYGAGVIKEEPVKKVSLPEFENKKIPVSLGKPTSSKMYNGGGYLDHRTELAVDGIIDNDSNSSFISAYADEDWLRIDLESAYKIQDVEIAAYPQYKGVRIDNVPDWCVVMASNDECSYNEAFTNYVVLEEKNGVYNLPEEYKDEQFRYFQIVKPEKRGILDAMIVREFTVNVDAKELVYNSALNKPVIYDGDIYYNDALTDGDKNKTINYTDAVIDLLTPSHIKTINVFGEYTDEVVFYGGLENTDPASMKLISENPDEKYRYIYIENKSGADISEVEVSTYFSDIISVWNYDEAENSYYLSVRNGDSSANRTYIAVVSQISAEGKVLTTDSETVTLKSGEEKTIKIFPDYAYKTEKTVCNLFREDTIPLADPTIFKDGELQRELTSSESVSGIEEELMGNLEAALVNNGIAIKLNAVDYLKQTDIYSIVIYDPQDRIIAYTSENAKSEDIDFEYVAKATDPEGSYKAKIIRTDSALETYYKQYTFSNVYPTDEELENCIESFKQTDGTDFAELYNTFYVKKRVIDFSDNPFINDENVYTNIGPIYAYARDNISKWSDAEGVEDINDVLACCKAAVIIYSAIYDDISLKDTARLYSAYMSKVFKEDYATTAELYKSDTKDFDEVTDNLIMCNALAAIKNKSVTSIVSALEKYSDVLNVDIENIKSKKIDIYEIAKKIDNTIPESYYDGLENEIASVLSKYDTSDSQGGGSGQSSGKSVGGAINTKLPAIEVALPIGEKIDEIKTPQYDDVPQGHWAKESIDKLTARGAISGTAENIFEPDRYITRAEFIKIVVSAFKIGTVPEVKITFLDCDVHDWFFPYVDAGVSSKIISGVSAEEFCPNVSILRQDAAVIADKTLLQAAFRMTEPVETSFTDSGEISEYAKYSVKLLVSNNVISGFEDGSFRPKEKLTRAEAAVIVAKLLELVER